MIRLEGVTRRFRTAAGERTALDAVDLSVTAGEVFGVVGRSGAGKSTLVRTINLLERPDAGRVWVGDQDLMGLKPAALRAARRRIGMIFQHFNLLHSRTIRDNVALPLVLEGRPRDLIARRVDELMERLGLAEHARKYPAQLSGGQKQRVGIARALATNPSLLLADEATSALDPTTTQEVLDLLRQVNKEFGITIVVITHEMEVVRSIADKVAVMENGRVVEQGSVYEVFSNPQTSVAAKFVATSLRNEPDVVETDDLLAHEGRLFTINLTEESGFFTAAARLKEAGVSIAVVHGGITTLQQHSFGKLTVRLSGDNNAIEEFYRTLSTTTQIEEIAR